MLSSCGLFTIKKKKTVTRSKCYPADRTSQIEGGKKALTVFVIHGNLLLLSMWGKFIRNKSASIFRFASQNLRLRLIFMLK